MKVRILGCGSSGGVPLIGCKCPVCVSTHPRNKRTRVSIVVEEGSTRVLVDASPDLRQQFLAADLASVDAVIITHGHADHTHGIDELRSVNFQRKAPLDVWSSAVYLQELRQRFGYAFQPAHPSYAWYAPVLVAREIPGPFAVGDLQITPFEQIHRADEAPVLGLRFGRFAYSTDARELPEAAFAALAGVEVWIVDCLMERPNFGHSHLEQTLAWIERVKPRRAVLTHMNHSVDYDEWSARLPPGVEVGYDGMLIDLT